MRTFWFSRCRASIRSAPACALPAALLGFGLLLLPGQPLRAAPVESAAASDLVELDYVKGPSPNIYDTFGAAVAVDDEVAVVGSPNGNATQQLFSTGVAFVFRRNGDQWVQEGTLAAPDADFGDRFGFSVAISGDLAAVGAPTHDGGGRVYVYERVGGTWAWQQTLASGTNANDRYGAAVALEGTRLAVGAPLINTGPVAPTGAVYVYERSGSAFGAPTQLFADERTGGEEFGYSLSLEGNRLAVGARYNQDVNFIQSGAVFVFAKGATWAQQARIRRTGLNQDAKFGESVALSSGTLLIGAPRTIISIGGNPTETGNAFVYVEGPVGTWTEQAQLRPAAPAPDDRIGQSVALVADKAVVGAPGRALLSDPDFGAAFEFQRTGANWSFVKSLPSTDAPASGSLGYAMHMKSGVLFVGQPQDLFPPQNPDRAGRAYIYAWPAASAIEVEDVDPPSEARVGQPITVTVAAVQAGHPIVHGEVVVKGYAFQAVDPETTCTVQLGLGAAGCAIAFPTGGDKTITASYLGAPGFAPDDSNNTTTYRALITSTQASNLVHTPNLNAPSTQVTVAIDVAAVAPGGGSPFGVVNVSYIESAPAPDTGGCSYTRPQQSSCNITLANRSTYAIQAQLSGNLSYGPSNLVVAQHRVNRLPQVAPENYFTLEDQVLQKTDPHGQTTPGNPDDDGPLANDFDNDSGLGQVLTVHNVSVGGIGGSIAMNPSGTFTYTPPQNVSGLATISYQVTDGIESVPTSFNIDVTAVNDQPSVTLLGDRVFPAGDSGTKTVPGFAVFSPGPPDESGQTVTVYTVVPVAFDAISNCNIANSGTLTCELAGPPTGVDVWSVTATDSGGTQYGAQDTSDPRYFRVVKGTFAAELAITKTNNATRLRQYQPTTYTITVSNTGPNTAPYVGVKDLLPATLENATWTCVGQNGATCPSAGSGSIDTTVTLPAASRVTFTLTATVNSPTDAPVVNTATVEILSAFGDGAGNNSATDTDPVDLFRNSFE